jgi:hypothetical protein
LATHQDIRINIQKSIALLYTNNEQAEKEIRKTIPFTIASEKEKNQGINLIKKVKDVHNEKYRSMKKEGEETSEVGNTSMV